MKKYKKKLFPDLNIQVSKWEERKEGDGLHFLKHKGHCYVVLRKQNQDHGYIADGTNSLRKSREVQDELTEKLNFPLKSCSYEEQSRLDHCGSSAVMIGLEFLRGYKRDKVDDKLFATRNSHMKSKVIKQLHPEENEAIDMTPLHLRRQWYKTECSKWGKEMDRKALFLHEQRCRGK